MRDGSWINYETRAYLGLLCPGLEHEIVIRNPEHQVWLGVPESVAKEFQRFRVKRDRVKFLHFIMQNVPLMRIRGYGIRVAFNYWSDADSKPYAMITKWYKRWGGPSLLLDVTNFETGRNERVMGSEWENFVKSQSTVADGGVKFKVSKTGCKNLRKNRTF